MTATGPMEVPTISLVSGITIISKIIKGTDLIKFITEPSTPFKTGIGLIPFVSLTTNKTPKGIPITYEKNEEAAVINKVSYKPVKIIETILILLSLFKTYFFITII